MKFLCVACDTPMKLNRTVGPDAGSLTIVYACPDCGKETAMLTNSMETQMVRSLGVKIGGKTVPAEPMEMVRGALAQARDPKTDGSATEGASKCPFGDVIADAFAKNDASKLVWTKEAEARLENIPAFAQPMAKKGVEMHALENGYIEIDAKVMDEVKDRFDM